MMTQDGDTLVNVLYDFDYTTEDGRSIKIREGEELLLVGKANDDWWHVIREGDTRPFYAPKAYLVESACDINYDVNANNQKVNNETVLFIANPLYSEYSSQPSLISENTKCEELKKLQAENILEGVTVIHIPGSPIVISTKEEEQSNNSQDASLTLDSLSEDAKLENTDEDCEDLDSNDDDGTKSTDSAYNDRLKKVIEDEGEKSHGEDEDEEEEEEEEHYNAESPIYANFPLLSSLSPPKPLPGENPQKALFNHWSEYVDDSGRRYYYNSSTKETTWKPPRKGFEPASDNLERTGPVPEAPPTPPRQPKPKLVRVSGLDGGSYSSSTDSLDLTELSPCTPPPAGFKSLFGGKGFPRLSPPTTPTLPAGWIQEINKDSGEIAYMHPPAKEKWHSSLDESGRIYYYAENGNESHWELPEMSPDFPSVGHNTTSPENSRGPSRPKGLNLASRKQKTNSLLVGELPQGLPESTDSNKSSSLPRAVSTPKWPSLRDGSINVIFHGPLHKTRLISNGKKQKKHWSSSYLVLTDLFLLCYKDQKAAEGINGGTKPETSFDLGSASVEYCFDKSSRKNVFQLSNDVLGQHMLLHDDNTKYSKEWFEAIQKAIQNLPSTKSRWLEVDPPLKEKFRKGSRLSRTKSTKSQQREAVSKGSENYNSSFPSSTSSAASLPSPSDETCNSTERKRRIRDKLRNFFLRRPSMESLREKGILKDEPVFGCHLHNLCAREKTNVPKFVQLCIEAIEQKDISADGLYRASGNLSQVQKIRFQVNLDVYDGLKTEDDVHVLTGALKMFFRDMKEPLFPFDTFNNFLKAISLNDRQKRTYTLIELVRKLPKPNYETLKYLMNHLHKVTLQSDQNRMHVQNVAIVFGPTLMWPETESTNLALDMMHQNQIMECLLLEFSSFFTR